MVRIRVRRIESRTGRQELIALAEIGEALAITRGERIQLADRNRRIFFERSRRNIQPRFVVQVDGRALVGTHLLGHLLDRILGIVAGNHSRLRRRTAAAERQCQESQVVAGLIIAGQESGDQSALT